jgi:curved DNA-binding protein CbpA
LEVELTALEAKITAGVNAFELLGVPPDAGKREIRRAWTDRSRRFHPDGLAARGLSHLRERVSDVFAALSEAQALLNDADQRERLRANVERGDPSGTSSSNPAALARAALESEVITKDADKLLRAGQYERALERYHAAATLNPDEPELIAALVWCRYNLSAKGPGDAAAAENELSRLLTDAPRLARGHYFHGMVLKDLNRLDAAVEALGRASAADPRLIDAERQARAIRLTRRTAPVAEERGQTKGRSRLKDLFGRK